MTTNIPPNSGLTVKFEHQKTEDSCGAACVAMVLDMIGANHPDQLTLLDEIQLFPTKDNGRNREKWSSSPDGMQDRLNEYSNSDYHFKIYANRNQALITRRMIWTIFHYKTPCITLISSGIHWVVVYQYSLPGDPPIDLDSFELQDFLGFFILDPNDREPREGVVDYNEWIKKIQTPETTGFWGDKYVALCDPDPPNGKKRKNMFSNMKKSSGKESQGPLDNAHTSNAADPNVTAKSDNPSKEQPKKTQPVKKLPSDLPIIRINKPGPDHGLIDNNTARAYSMWHLKFGGFYDPTKFTRMMVNPGPGKPMLVRALDSEDSWYIVPFIEMNKKTGGIMRINAKDARFLEASFAIHADQPITLTRFSDKQIENLIIDKYGKTKGKMIIDPILVWKPCVQSYTRFLPFYKVKMGSKTVYVRIDGNVYSRLTQRKR